MGVAQFGSALEWGSRGRGFKSLHPYQKKILHNSVGFFFAFLSPNKGLERVGIADTTAIYVACLRQMMDTHRLPHRRDSVAEQIPSPIPTKNLYHWMQVFLFILHCLKKGLERVEIADTMAISVACLRQMMDTHRLPPRRDSVAEQVPSPIGLSYICVNASYIAYCSYICLAASDIAHFVRSCGGMEFSPSVTSCHLPP